MCGVPHIGSTCRAVWSGEGRAGGSIFVLTLRARAQKSGKSPKLGGKSLLKPPKTPHLAIFDLGGGTPGGVKNFFFTAAGGTGGSREVDFP